MNKNEEKYFFVPRIGANYENGFNGLRTLIVGAYHVCYCNCEHKTICCNPDTVFEMDYKCPAYSNVQLSENPVDELCLHNSNIIEINSYCDDDARYPTYTAFTRYMLDCKKGLTTEQKNDFWDSVVFYNFYQSFSASDTVPTTCDIDTTNKDAVKALAKLLEEIKPQVIYVWTKYVSDAIDCNIDKLKGLRKESLTKEHSTMELYLYSYNYSMNTVTLSDIRNYLQKSFPNREITFTAEGLKKKVPQLDKVIQRAIERGALLFDNGRLIIPNTRKEQEGGYILNQLKLYYNFSSWDEIEHIIVKYKKNGEKVKELRKLHKYNNVSSDAAKCADLDKHIFGIH